MNVFIRLLIAVFICLSSLSFAMFTPFFLVLWILSGKDWIGAYTDCIFSIWDRMEKLMHNKIEKKDD